MTTLAKTNIPMDAEITDLSKLAHFHSVIQACLLCHQKKKENNTDILDSSLPDRS
jgi:hypothetical protein